MAPRDCVSASDRAATVQIISVSARVLFSEEVCRRKGIPPAVIRLGSGPRKVRAELSSLVKECEAISDHFSFRVTPIPPKRCVLAIRLFPVRRSSAGAETQARWRNIPEPHAQSEIEFHLGRLQNVENNTQR